jgi:hypothetical protein
MKSDQYGQLVYNEQDLVDLLMSGHDINKLTALMVDKSINFSSLKTLLEQPPKLLPYTELTESLEEFDYRLQQHWHMPDTYQNLDIAKHVLGLCLNEEQLQRAGEELLLYAERDLFNLLRYLKYLVDVMTDNKIIWGVGRGSSVSSYVLYLLKVHRIDSMYYNLDIREFLR